MKRIALVAFILALLGERYVVAQSTIIGFAPQFKQQRFFLWKEADFLSKKKTIVSETLVDSQGVFQFKIPPGAIEKYTVGTEQLNGYLLVQNGAKYQLEFIADSPQSKSYSVQEEIELTFIDLDSNDINFKILGFEAWIDEQLSELHFERLSEGEMLRKITLLKLTVVKDASTDTCSYFRDYLKYSIANIIDNLKYMGAPTQQELYKTYLYQQPIQYHVTHYTEFFEKYYDQFISQMEVVDAAEIFRAYAALNFQQQDSIIARHCCTGDAALRSLINLYMLKQAIYGNFIPKSVIKANLQLQCQASVFQAHQIIAANLMQKFSVLETGDAFPFSPLKFVPSGEKPVYIHAFNPSNIRCIQEITALKKLNASYGSKIDFLTLYVEKSMLNESEQKALNQITWKKIALTEDDDYWKTLGVSSFPYYLLVDKEGNLLSAPALSPSPNGKYETIEKSFFDLTKP